MDTQKQYLIMSKFKLFSEKHGETRFALIEFFFFQNKRPLEFFLLNPATSMNSYVFAFQGVPREL